MVSDGPVARGCCGGAPVAVGSGGVAYNREQGHPTSLPNADQAIAEVVTRQSRTRTEIETIDPQPALSERHPTSGGAVAAAAAPVDTA